MTIKELTQRRISLIILFPPQLLVTFRRKKTKIAKDPFSADLHLAIDAAMDRVDEMLAERGLKALPRKKYKFYRPK